MRRLAIGGLAAALSSCALIADITDFNVVSQPPPLADGGDGTPDASTDGRIGDDAADLTPVHGDAAPDAACASCVSGTCESDGVCVMAVGLSGAETIALVGNLVVFAESATGRVRACPQAGCGSTGPIVLKQGLSGPRLQRPELGGGLPVLFETGGNGDVQELLADGGTSLVKTAAQATSAQLSDSVLLMVSAAGVSSCPRPLLECTLVGGSTRPTCALVGTTVVWAGASTGIASFELASGSAAAIGNHTVGEGVPASLLAADHTVVHGIANNAVYTWPLDGGTARQLVTLHDVPAGLSIDEGHIYLAGDGVRVVDKSTGQMVARFAGRATRDVVASSEFLFWLEGGSLARAPR